MPPAAENMGPRDFLRRSFVYRLLAEAGAEFAEVSGAAVAAGFGGPVEDEAASARALGLADLSPLPRIGFKGPGALRWLADQGVTGLAGNNRADRQEDGDLAVRLAPGEALILGPVTSTSGLCERLGQAGPGDGAAGCYPVPRGDSHFWFALTGADAAPMLAKLCGVDLRPGRFADGEVAQTSVARLGTVVVRADLGAVPVYHLLGDSASAEYYWRALLDAMSEFEGRPVGLAALRVVAGE